MGSDEKRVPKSRGRPTTASRQAAGRRGSVGPIPLDAPPAAKAPMWLNATRAVGRSEGRTCRVCADLVQACPGKFAACESLQRRACDC